MLIHGTEVNFNITNPDHKDNYMAGIRKLEEAQNELNKKENEENALEIMLQAIKDFFYEAVGLDVIADVDNVQEAIETYKIFLKDVEEQNNKLTQTVAEFRGMAATGRQLAEEKSKVAPVQLSEHRRKIKKARPPKV